MIISLSDIVIVSIFVIAFFSLGCGGGGSGSYIAPTGSSLSGSVVLPPGTTSTITKNLIANVSYEMLKVNLFDTNDKDIVAPVELGRSGVFSFTNVPFGKNYQLVVITPSGKKLLRKHIDVFSASKDSVTVDSGSTDLAILVKQSNFEKSEANLSEVITPVAISTLIDKITDWLVGNNPTTESDVFKVVVSEVGESEIENLIDKVPDLVFHSVYYDGNGNTGGVAPIDNVAYQANSSVTVKDNVGVMVKTGYIFVGWNTAADGSGINYSPGSNFSINVAHVTLYAQWSLIPTYTVSYNGNGNTGGSVPIDNQTYHENSIVTIKANTEAFVRNAHQFVCWNTAKDGSGTDYVAGNTIKIQNSNVVLYAKWLRTSGKIVSVATGMDFSLFLREDGTVWATGNNTVGQLGDGSYNQSLTPVQVVQLNNVCKIAAGKTFAIALTDDGNLRGWGGNDFNCISSSGTNFNTPQSIYNLKNIKDFAVADQNFMALDNLGKVWVWGHSNIFGVLTEPVLIDGLENITDIDCGAYWFSLALKSDGTVWAWGSNSNGELGDGFPKPGITKVPQQIPGLSNIVKIAAGAGHGLALQDNGDIWAWGSNLTGQLGIGNTTIKYSPVFVCTATPLSHIYASMYRSHFLTENGEVWSWGRGLGTALLGSLGYDDLSPVKRNLTGIKQIVFYHNHGFYIQDDGYLYGWGSNYYGELGSGSTSSSSPLTEIILPN